MDHFGYSFVVFGCQDIVHFRACFSLLCEPRIETCRFTTLQRSECLAEAFESVESWGLWICKTVFSLLVFKCEDLLAKIVPRAWLVDVDILRSGE
ncbi:hypothetical protein VNO78_22021 [Psophocarpus tetragonolobus]|uniref:Uncharacterized protein n=1 Tax=Psophocarpus tetragonolobus TaxID=3891 RepID=A0AAN9SDM7_PSOTE